MPSGFYRAGAVGVWFDEFRDQDEHGKGSLFPLSLIIQLPQSHTERQKLVKFFNEQVEQESAVDPETVEQYMGNHYCQFTIHDKLLLDFCSNCNVMLEEANLAVPTLHVEISVRNLAYEKVVGIVFSADNWSTVRTAYGTHSSGDKDGREVWKVAASVGAGNAVNFAVFYQVAGSEYWDNNFGRNYRVTPSRREGFAIFP